jgi:hypothetical protein
MKIPILDKCFISYCKGLSPFNPFTNNIEWVDASKNDCTEILKDKKTPIFFFQDCLFEDVNYKVENKKIAWLLEPKSVTPWAYKEETIQYIAKNYNYVITHEQYLVEKYSNFLYAPYCANFALLNDNSMVKSKLVSMISSSKNWTEGHKFRLETTRKVKGYDLFGRGFKEIEHKNEGLEPYMFSIAIENSVSNYYWTEKIMDCFSTKTIPIYRGCDVSKWFNSDGIIYFKTHEELQNIINNKLTKEFYESKMSAIEENFNKARNVYYSPEDFVFRHYPFLFE